MQRVFEREGIRLIRGRAASARKDGDDIVIATDHGGCRGYQPNSIFMAGQLRW
jgi:hypothetical protein